MFTPRQIELIRESFRKLSQDSERSVAAFYDRLFEMEPQLRFLFPEELAETQQKLISMFTFLVLRLDRWEEVRPRLANLGLRHASYGVQPADYIAFWHAVTEVLRDALAVPEGSETHEAWRILFNAISDAMIQGAADEADLLLGLEGVS